jgi:hypothetical protein
MRSIGGGQAEINAEGSSLLGMAQEFLHHPHELAKVEKKIDRAEAAGLELCAAGLEVCPAA